MTKKSGFTAFLLLIAATPGQADPYHWCANDGASRSGGLSCYYSTQDQCEAAISASGAFCMPNYFDRQPESHGRLVAQATKTGGKVHDERQRGGKTIHRRRGNRELPNRDGEPDDYVYGKIHYRLKPAK